MDDLNLTGMNAELANITELDSFGGFARQSFRVPRVRIWRVDSGQAGLRGGPGHLLPGIAKQRMQVAVSLACLNTQIGRQILGREYKGG